MQITTYPRVMVICVLRENIIRTINLRNQTRLYTWADIDRILDKSL